MSKRLLLPFLALLAVALVAAGCGEDDGDKTANPTASAQTSTKASGTDTGAATLRANLTAALQEHVYLAGISVTQGVGQGLDSGEFKAAAGALDENSKALSSAIGSVYGDEAGDQFLALWRSHINMFVDYTKGKATKNASVVAKARKDLDGYRTEFGAFLASANPNLTAEAVADELKPHVASMFKAIDSVVAKRASAFEELRQAASHMPQTANVLASAIAKQKPDMFPSA